MNLLSKNFLKQTIKNSIFFTFGILSFHYYNKHFASSKFKKIEVKNFFETFEEKPTEEIIEKILENKNLKLERIITNGQITPPGEWYNQENDEWVLLLKGSALILFEDFETKTLNSGDYILIPKFYKHRVQWVDPHNECIWIALHFKD